MFGGLSSLFGEAAKHTLPSESAQHAMPSESAKPLPTPDTETDTEDGASSSHGSVSQSQMGESQRETSTRDEAAESQRRAAEAAVNRTLKAKDHHAVLGVAEPISPTRLKKAYRRLCLQLHPDRCQAPRAEEAFKRVQEAFAALDQNGPRSSAARAQAKRTERKQAEHRQRDRDRGWTSRGIDPRYGAPATRGRRPGHLEPPTKRANGKTAFAPKAGPPPRPSSRGGASHRPSTQASPPPMGPMEA